MLDRGAGDEGDLFQLEWYFGTLQHSEGFQYLIRAPQCGRGSKDNKRLRAGGRNQAVDEAGETVKVVRVFVGYQHSTQLPRVESGQPKPTMRAATAVDQPHPSFPPKSQAGIF